jgi:hypothetical protein
MTEHGLRAYLLTTGTPIYMIHTFDFINFRVAFSWQHEAKPIYCVIIYEYFTGSRTEGLVYSWKYK